MAGLEQQFAMLKILLATCEQTLATLRAADNVLDTDLADDLERMIERTRREVAAFADRNAKPS